MPKRDPIEVGLCVLAAVIVIAVFVFMARAAGI